ncbi:MAG: DUF4129 domain-containing protein [Actinomycetes bacterium]
MRELPAPAPPSEVRDAVRRILDGPAYAEAEPNAVQRALARLRDAIAELLAELTLRGDGRPSTIATVLLVVVAVALVAAAAWWLLRRVDAAPAPAPAVGPTPGRDAQGWREEARRREAAGDLHGAVLAWFRACTSALHEGGVLDDRPGMTVGEVRRAVASRSPEQRGVVDAAADAFEDVWYGHADPQAPLERLRSAADRLGRAGAARIGAGR